MRSGIIGKFFAPGTGKGRAHVSGILCCNSLSVGNIDAGVDTLMSFTIPGKTFFPRTRTTEKSQCLRICAWGGFAANGNNKTVILDLDGTTLLTSGVITPNDKRWYIEAVIIRTGINTQQYNAQGLFDTTIVNSGGGLTKTEADDLIIKVTGEAVATDDILQRGFIVESIGRP